MQRPVQEVLADLNLARATERISSEEHETLVAKVNEGAADGFVDFDSSRLDSRHGARLEAGGTKTSSTGPRAMSDLVPGRFVSLLLKGAAALLGVLGIIYLVTQAFQVSDAAANESGMGYEGLAYSAVMLALVVLACIAVAAIIDILRLSALIEVGKMGGAPPE